MTLQCMVLSFQLIRHIPSLSGGCRLLACSWHDLERRCLLIQSCCRWTQTRCLTTRNQFRWDSPQVCIGRLRGQQGMSEPLQVNLRSSLRSASI